MNTMKIWRLLSVLTVISSGINLVAQETAAVAQAQAASSIANELGDNTEGIIGSLAGASAGAGSLSFDNIDIGPINVEAFRIYNTNVTGTVQCKGDAICTQSINVNVGGLNTVGKMYDLKLNPTHMTKAGKITKLGHANPNFSATNRIVEYQFIDDNNESHEVVFMVVPVSINLQALSTRLHRELTNLRKTDKETQTIIYVFSRPTGQTLWKKNAELKYANQSSDIEQLVTEVGIQPSGDFLVMLGSYIDANTGKTVRALEINIAE